PAWPATLGCSPSGCDPTSGVATIAVASQGKAWSANGRTAAMGAQENGFDVIVAGAGYVGLTIAVAIAEARPSLKVAVVDAAPEGAWQRDGRASAIAAAAVRMLERLGCWQEIAPKAQAITDMVITDSRTA